MALFKILRDFKRFAAVQLLTFAGHILNCFKKRPDLFPAPVISLDELSAQIDKFGSLNTEAMDGSRRVIAARDEAGASLIDLLDQLAAYVKAIGDRDEVICAASGFNYTTTRRTQRPPRNAAIRKIAHGGISGTMKFRIVAVPGASSYEIRWAARQIDRSPLSTEWTAKQFSDTRKFLVITGLTPGTMYVFQVRALIGEKFTDWSDAASQMCL